MYALNLAEDGRILSATYEKYAPVDAVIVETLPDGDISEYRYINDGYIYDPLPKTVEPEATTEPTLASRVSNLESDSAEMKEALELLLSGVTE